MSLSKKNLDKLNKFKKNKNLNNESKNISNYTNLTGNDNLITNPLNSEDPNKIFYSLIDNSESLEETSNVNNSLRKSELNQININSSGHGLSAGLILSLNFTTGDGIDGVYTIQTAGTDTFTVKTTTVQFTSGNVSFNVNSTIANPTVYLFHSGNNMKDSLDIIWQANTYSRMPVKAEGFKYSGKGKLPRPTLTLSNLLGTITAILQLTNQITP